MVHLGHGKDINLEWVNYRLAIGMNNTIQNKEHIWQAHLHMCHVNAQGKTLRFTCGLKSMCIQFNNTLYNEEARLHALT